METVKLLTACVKFEQSIECVAFDFDGTLALLNIDFPAMRRCVLDLVVSFGVPGDGLDHLLALEMIEEARKRILARQDGGDEAFAKEAEGLIRAFEIEGADRGSLFPGVMDMFAELGRAKVKTAIVTRNCVASVLKLFPGVEEVCACIVTREHTPLVKPHPEHLRIALRELGTGPERTVMVGDHPMDMELGKKAGTLAAGVLTGYAGEALLREAGADLVVHRVTDILGYFQGGSGPCTK